MKKILLKNAYLYTMAGTEIKNGDLLIKGDKIAAVGEELQVDGAETIDLSGQY
ncbi:MAG TPA: amidohydrolase, partial [Firmicutes bacterium]|nr:amidohydrolase [Bacillota bacterium]